MSGTAWIVVGVVVLVVVIGVVFRNRLGRIVVRLGRASVSAEEGPQRRAVDVTNAEAGRDLKTNVRGGEVKASKAKAGRDIDIKVD